MSLDEPGWRARRVEWDALNYCFQKRKAYVWQAECSEPGSLEEQRAQRGISTFDRYIRMHVRDHPGYVEMLADEEGTARLAALALSETKAMRR